MTGARLLVVEDERIVALHLRQQLIKLGYDVGPPVASGRQALEKIEESHPDLILMDIHIEGDLDGIETATRITAGHRIPVIYLTAYSEPTTLDRARATGPYGYLIKPFSERELHATIQMALERSRAEKSERASEAALRQAQKMEAIGQLTGGLAHDFNNLLAVVIGNLELAGEEIAADHAAAPLLHEAFEECLRGAQLIRSLLAFSRQQDLTSRQIELGSMLTGLTGMLRHMLGEPVEASLTLAPDLWPVHLDQAQLESALLNLAINARDAMPQGGKLVFEATNVTLDAEYGAQNPGVAPGDYILVAVSDTGVGMSPEVLARAFEPYFTTKEVGKGSGLGLSMVFGFINQSGGHVKIYSELGHGTTVRLYLPRAQAAAAVPEAVKGVIDRRLGVGRVVLVVEDHEDLRRMVVRSLTRLGFDVIEADRASSALETLNGGLHPDLLLTDMVMPGTMNGLELAKEAVRRMPRLRVLLTSGFTEQAAQASGEALPWPLLVKPYRNQDLIAALTSAMVDPEDPEGSKSV